MMTGVSNSMNQATGETVQGPPTRLFVFSKGRSRLRRAFTGLGQAMRQYSLAEALVQLHLSDLPPPSAASGGLDDEYLETVLG